MTYEFVSEEEQPVVDKLNQLTGHDLTLQDYDDWLSGGENYDKFNEAVIGLLGQDIFDKLETAARTQDGLLYALGLGPKISGGVDLQKLGVRLKRRKSVPEATTVDTHTEKMVRRLNELSYGHHYFKLIDGKIHLMDDNVIPFEDNEPQDLGVIEPLATLRNLENASEEQRVYNVIELSSFLDESKKTALDEIAIEKDGPKGLGLLPPACFAMLPSSDRLIKIIKGESGYYPYRDAEGNPKITTQEEVDNLNKELGVSPEAVEAMMAGSMWGWDIPAVTDFEEGKTDSIEKAIDKILEQEDEMTREEVKNDGFN